MGNEDNELSVRVRRWVELEVKARMPRGGAIEDELNAVYDLAAELATLLNEANDGRPSAMRSA